MGLFVGLASRTVPFIDATDLINLYFYSIEVNAALGCLCVFSEYFFRVDVKPREGYLKRNSILIPLYIGC